VLSVALVLLLLAVFWAGYDSGQSEERKTEGLRVLEAQMSVTSLRQAITNFFSAYGRWPCGTNRTVDYTFGPGTQKEVIDALLGLDKSLNPMSKNFLVSFPKSYRGGEIVDPWTNTIYITLDLNNDGRCHTLRWGIVDTNGPLVWSETLGPIKSW